MRVTDITFDGHIFIVTFDKMVPIPHVCGKTKIWAFSKYGIKSFIEVCDEHNISLDKDHEKLLGRWRER